MASHCNTLLVEDDQPSRDALVRFFDKAGVQVKAAANLGEAIAALHLPHVRVVLLDLDLPDGSGMGILNRIRNHRLPVKVAVVSGSVDPASEEKLRWLKPDAVFPKPYAPDELLVWTVKALSSTSTPAAAVER